MSKDQLVPDEPDTEIDPYATLNLTPAATEAEIRSAYKKLALRHHPDKVGAGERDAAHQAFQKIAFAHAVLSDPVRRARYDRTGSTAESVLDDEGFDWSRYFRERYEEVTTEAIADFALKYKGGDEERADLIRAYNAMRGRMDQIYKYIMLSNPLDDEERFQALFKDAIEKGEVKAYDAFVNESSKSRKARITRAQKEAKEAEEEEKKIKSGKRKINLDDEIEVEDDPSSDEDDEEDGEDPEEEEDEEEEEKVKPKAPKRAAKKADTKPKKAAVGGMGDLAAMIQQRQKSRADTFLDDLEAKYAPKSGKNKKRRAEDEPPEEAFARNRAKTSSPRKDAKNISPSKKQHNAPKSKNFRGRGRRLGTDGED